MKPDIRESEIQTQITDWLNASGLFWRRMPMGGVKHGGVRKRNPMKGFPDLWGLQPGGRLFAIEVKRPDGRFSKEQIQWRKYLIDNGAIYIAARSIDDLNPLYLEYK